MKLKVADVVAWMDDFAPRHLAESWDNVGLLFGDPDAPCERVMTCLTVTDGTSAEAVNEQADLIVTHHPILFRGTKSLRADQPETAMLWPLARAGVAVQSPHTAFDNTQGGINDGLAERIGLQEVGPLRRMPGPDLTKIVVFCPRNDREPVLAAAFAAGAGKIGAYGECSFSSAGYGTFFGDETTRPSVGEAGHRETVREWRVEMVCPVDRVVEVLKAIRAAHSYEEAAIDVIPIQAAQDGPGVGRIGRLAQPESLRELAALWKHSLPAPGLQFVGDPSRRIERVAIACGAADDLLKEASEAGADVFLTGEARFHKALEAESLGIGLVLAGHYATERPGVEDLADRLAEAFPTLKVWASRSECDPLRILL